MQLFCLSLRTGVWGTLCNVDCPYSQVLVMLKLQERKPRDAYQNRLAFTYEHFGIYLSQTERKNR